MHAHLPTFSDDPYSNQDSRYGASNGYEAPTYDYNAAMPIPTMPYEASEPMEYSMGDPCMVVATLLTIAF